MSCDVGEATESLENELCWRTAHAYYRTELRIYDILQLNLLSLLLEIVLFFWFRHILHFHATYQGHFEESFEKCLMPQNNAHYVAYLTL